MGSSGFCSVIVVYIEDGRLIDCVFRVSRYNASGRRATDHFVAMDISKPVGSSFDYRVLPMRDFSGNNGDGTIDLVGISGVALGGSGASSSPPLSPSFRIWAVNHRPPLDAATGALVADASATGANSTVEVFETDSGVTELRHLKTFAHPVIATPNRVAGVPGDEKGLGFYFTNDKGQTKTGWKHDLSPYYGGGDVSYCSGELEEGCRMVSYGGYRFPNGLMRGSDGLVYVPSAISGGVRVLEPQSDGSLKKVGEAKMDYPIDNLSEDGNGDIFAAVFPQMTDLQGLFERPMEKRTPSAVWRIRKVGGGGGKENLRFETERILEDRDSEALSFSTTVEHDSQTGMIFAVGITNPFISVCERV